MPCKEHNILKVWDGRGEGRGAKAFKQSNDITFFFVVLVVLKVVVVGAEVSLVILLTVCQYVKHSNRRKIQEYAMY